MYNPVDFFLAHDISVPGIDQGSRDSKGNFVQTLAFSGEQTNEEMLNAFRHRGINKISIRIFPVFPLNYARWPKEQFEAWLDEQYASIFQERT